MPSAPPPQISGETDQVYRDLSRADAIAAAEAPGDSSRVEAGADPQLHIREQFSGRQGRMQLSSIVQRVQAAGERSFGVGKK